MANPDPQLDTQDYTPNPRQLPPTCSQQNGRRHRIRTEGMLGTSSFLPESLLGSGMPVTEKVLGNWTGLKLSS